MNIAIIIAGGSGARMNQDIPKQFLSINDKPIIIYTLDCLEHHPRIDAMLCVCIPGWVHVLWAFAKQHSIHKLRWIVEGGTSAQESIRNGLVALNGIASANDTVLLHDGIRPILDDIVLNDLLDLANRYSGIATSLPYNEQIFVTYDGQTSTESIPREIIRRVATPQAYQFGKLLDIYTRAFAEDRGIQAGTYANTLWVEYGETLYLSKGSERNIKLTTVDDLELFKAYLSMKPTEWLKRVN
ncbi:2-C-methyl-D-erythritol 4-phosphate cytidylyltransferase [Clostridia bacterium]|nr:2-C-methyl-D-erythritol 4-phosphate cytidylyltransferase [Clostridia bacterium]